MSELHALCFERPAFESMEAAAERLFQWIQCLGPLEPRLSRLLVLEEGGGEPPLRDAAGLLRALEASRIDWGGEPPPGAPTHRVRLVNGLEGAELADARIHLRRWGGELSSWLDLRLAEPEGRDDVAPHLDRLMRRSIEALSPMKATLQTPRAVVDRWLAPRAAPPQAPVEEAPLPAAPPPASAAPRALPSFMRPELQQPAEPAAIPRSKVPSGEMTMGLPVASPIAAGARAAAQRPSSGPIVAALRLAVALSIGGASDAQTFAEFGLDPAEWAPHARALRAWLGAGGPGDTARLDVFRFLSFGAPGLTALRSGALRAHRAAPLFERSVTLIADIAAAGALEGALQSHGLPASQWMSAAERARQWLQTEPALAERLRGLSRLVGREAM